jgi:hypothetical protein
MQMEKSKKKITGKYTFSLRDINPDEVCKKYDIPISTSIEDKPVNQKSEKFQPKETTKVSDLMSKVSTPQIVSFLSETKRITKCSVNIIDMQSKKNLDQFHSVDCFWCRHPFSTKPIGCPIKYVPHQLIKGYTNDPSKDNYIIKENITDKKAKDIMERKKDGEESVKKFEIKSGGYFETDGFFCSFNCCKAFILDNKHNSLYDDSERLLIQMYNEIFVSKISKIKEADSWRLLKKSGGFLDIDKYRSNFNHVSYEYHGYICRPVGHLWEEHLRF